MPEGTASWWSGTVDVVYDCYGLGTSRGVPETPEQLAAGLLVGRGGVLVTTSRHAIEVRLRVIPERGPDPDGSRASRAQAIVDVPASGWALYTADGPVPEAPKPLLGPGRWLLTLDRETVDDVGCIDGHTLHVHPLDETARGFMPPFVPRAPRRHIRWRPGPGTYHVLITRAGDHDAAPDDTDVEIVVQERQGEWWLDRDGERLMPLGEKWETRRGWALGPGETVSVTDARGTPMPEVPTPFAVGPAKVRLAEQNREVGDIVDAGDGGRWVLPSEDSYRLEVVPGDG
ncbi:MAG: hypothetical protein QM638_15390 [Nocardioides sp.]|uniref:hypothetical protein n=1 Tax=Nocardioides sp. TaxID=35761 RepID=UPI0039E6BDE7